jgi:hypothetical protein
MLDYSELCLTPQAEVAMEGPVGIGSFKAELAESVLQEALACPPGTATKAFHAALLKLASGLDLQAASQVC